MTNRKSKPLTKLDQIIKNWKDKGLADLILPIDCTLKVCTIEEKLEYIEQNKYSKVFQDNLKILKESIITNRPVSFIGRNLNFRDDKDYIRKQPIGRKSVEKTRRKKRQLNKLKEESKELDKEKKEKEEALEYIEKYFGQFKN